MIVEVSSIESYFFIDITKKRKFKHMHLSKCYELKILYLKLRFSLQL